MIFLDKKLISRFTWILLASLVGIGIGYMMIKGATLAYGEIYRKTQKFVLKNSDTPSQDILFNIPTPKEVVKKDIVSIGFVGDIIPGINAYENIFSGVTPYTEKPDVMIGNFEGVATINNPYIKCGPDSKKCFAFNGDVNFLKLLSEASFDVLNVANNHFNDFGEEGQTETLKEIREAGIIASGTKDQITYLTRNNLKIGIIGFSTYPWTTNMNNTETLGNIIRDADQNANIVLVVFHGGGEGLEYIHTPVGVEMYLGENRGDLRLFAHSAIDAGADAVLGSGPHILRGIEKYNGKLIAYSMGNFASANTVSTLGPLKKSAMIEITFDKNGSLVSGTIFPFEIDSSGAPHPDLSNASITAINQLSKEDFGEQGVILSSSGDIIFK